MAAAMRAFGTALAIAVAATACSGSAELGVASESAAEDDRALQDALRDAEAEINELRAEVESLEAEPDRAEASTSGGESDSDQSTGEDTVGETETPTIADSGSASEEPTTSQVLFVEGEVDIPPGQPGVLGIVAIGPVPSDGGFGSSVPIIVRNRTDRALTQLQATGTARAPDGGLVGSGSSQGFAPEVVLPGQWTMGYVYFSEPLGGNEDLELSIDAASVEETFLGAIDAAVVEVAVRPDNASGTSLVGIAENTTSDPISGPVSVFATCFDQESTPLVVFQTFTDANEIEPGGSTSFTVNTFDTPDCAAWAVGASGWGF